MEHYYHISTFFPESSVLEALVAAGKYATTGHETRILRTGKSPIILPFEQYHGEREIAVSEQNGKLETAPPPQGAVNAADLHFKVEFRIPVQFVGKVKSSQHALEISPSVENHISLRGQILVNFRELESDLTEIWFVAHGAVASDILTSSIRLRILFIELLKANDGVLGFVYKGDDGEHIFWYNGKRVNCPVRAPYRTFERLVENCAE